MAQTQQNRQVEIKTPLGTDVLLLSNMTVTEELGRMFTMELELFSSKENIKFEDLLAQNISVRLDLPNNKKRYFNGHISRFSQSGNQGSFAVYQATVHPWLWFLTRTSDCRIFQNKTVPNIVKEVFRNHGFTDFEEKLGNTYRTWEYCVQYRESDFNFVSRLLEQEGIYYFFKHEKGKHTLILSDNYSSHEKITGYQTIPYYPPDDTTVRDEEYISSWFTSKQVQTGIYALNEYDFKRPKTDLKVSSVTIRKHSASDFEVYDYPGEYVENADGDVYARARIEELHVHYEQAQGQSNARGVVTGGLFGLNEYPREDQNREYLVVAATHDVHSDEFESGGGDGSPVYSNSFSVIESKTPFRTGRTTPKPIVQGPQTAIVVGQSGEEIYTDEHGRVKLQFHWDRYGPSSENSSCWVRVSQVHAGKGFGGIDIPRIGEEVIVEFLEGDPDRPIITGRVYNGDNKSPTKLPDDKMVSGLKSNSTPEGGGFNELRFNDKKGEEQIFFNAEKNQDIRVKNDHFEIVGNERHLIVKSDQLEQVEGDKHLTVKGDKNEKVNGTVSRKIDMDLQEKIGSKHGLEAGSEIHLKAGMNVVIEAGMSITLKAGGGFVVVGPAGVTISGTPILINSGGSAGSGSGCSPDAAKLPMEADTAVPGEVSKAPPPRTHVKKPPTFKFSNPQAQTLATAAKYGTPFCEKCEAAKKAAAQSG